MKRTGFSIVRRRSQERITEKTRAILINSPSNPTGNLLSESTMRSISRLSPYIISDEIYHGLVYEGREHSILEFTDHAFVLNGFSKLYAMTGLRLGYLIAPQEIRPPHPEDAAELLHLRRLTCPEGWHRCLAGDIIRCGRDEAHIR